MSVSERFLVAGYGSIGKRHLGNLRQMFPQADIAVLRSGVAGSDSVVPPGADHVFYDFEAVRAFAPQAAIVATPATYHVELTRRLLALGCHVLLEKPIAAASEAVPEMIAEARRSGRVLMIGYNLVFTPAMAAFRDAVRSGMVGRPLCIRAEVGQYLPDWRPGSDYRRGASARRDLGGGVLLELSHELHYLEWIFGRVDWVQATVQRSGTLELEVEDLALLNLGFAEGAVASVQLDFLQRTYSRFCKVVGSAGTLLWDASQQSVLFFPPNEKQGREVFREASADRNGAYLRELEHFFNCVRNGTRPMVDADDGWAVLRVIEAARTSASEGKRIVL
ncbi:MAG: Gfo/Idh/MocA family oxidoreductase [Nibricoccus sp.]